LIVAAAIAGCGSRSKSRPTAVPAAAAPPCSRWSPASRTRSRESIWSKVGDPGKYTNPSPVGTGPYTVSQFTSQGITFKANPSYWGGRPAVSTVEFPTYASSNSALAALQTNQLHWGGNFIPGVQQVFVAGNPDHHVWFPPVQTNSLEPNLTKFPTNQLAVRKAISLAIDRGALSRQAEGGIEPPMPNVSGLTLPIFQQFMSRPSPRTRSRRIRTSPRPSRCPNRPAT
jgi:peptide/nickel transport system substrate-binding protein